MGAGGRALIKRAGVLAVVMAAIGAIAPPSLGARDASPSRVCPPGHSVLSTSVGLMCVHDAADPMPPAMRASAPRAAPRCYGDGVSGNRIQLLYVYARGTRIRAGIADRIARDIVPTIEGVVRNRSRQQGREIGLRLHMAGCKVRADIVPLSAATLQPKPEVGEQFGRIVDELASLGYDASDRKYLVWADTPAAPNRPGALVGPCGIASSVTIGTAPFDNPTPANYSNGIVPQYAVSFATSWALLGGTPCWGGRNGAVTETHELFHTLGAVQASAPNSNGLGHCTDAPDIMCYSEGGVSTRDVCSYSRTKLLDCGGDDYFNVNPPSGSYLATHWNTARSSFLGDAPTDGLPVKLRRP